MSGKEWYEKTTLANVAAAVAVVGGLWVAYWTQNKELVGVIIGGAATYLWRREE